MHYKAGISFYKSERWDDAIAQFKKAVEIAPDFLSARCCLGLSYYHKKEIEESIVQLNHVFRIDPYNYTARIWLAALYKENGETEKVVTEVLNAMSLGDDILKNRI